MFRNFSGIDGETTKRNFVLGERSLRAYFAGGNVRYLKEAESSFSEVKPGDKEFDGARFYLGVAKAQLRKTTESIEILEDLRARAAKSERRNQAEFERQIGLQLAYAHIKSYTESGYLAAEAELERIEEAALRTGQGDALLQAQSMKAFLYSVLAGHGEDEGARPGHATHAIELAERILSKASRSDEGAQALRFEALNALGIAWMRAGEGEWYGFDDRASCWARAQSYYDQALEIIPNSVRVLQNLALMRLLQCEAEVSADQEALLREAQEFCERSLGVSDQDQYPYYLLARIAVRQGKRSEALEYVRTGRTRPGAVKEESWMAVWDEASRLL